MKMIPKQLQAVRFLTLGLLFCASPLAAAYAQRTKQASPSGYDKTSATVEAIMTQAVKNIGARYNLNEFQLKLTDELMKRDVRRFLIEHEKEIWPAIRSIISYGMGTKPPADPDEAKRFASSARPLIEMAKDAIFSANDEWREILSEPQKAVHDYDMREMHKTFAHISKSLTAWEKGNAAAAPIFPSPPVPDGTEPPHPVQPRIQLINTGTLIATPDPGILETITEEFIREFHLEEGQITAARSILVEFKAKAESFRTSKKAAFAQIAEEMAEAARDTKARKAAATKHKDLLRPFYLIIEEMQDRFHGLLTSAQIHLYASKPPPTAPATPARTPSSGKTGNGAKENAPATQPAKRGTPRTEKKNDAKPD